MEEPATAHVWDESYERPKKKRALSPQSIQRQQLNSLLAKPEQTINLPAEVKSKDGNQIAPPPDFVNSIQGSSAGAGSGEFHVYKNSRRREQDRMKLMQDEVDDRAAQQEFDDMRDQRRSVDEAKTAKNRAKRQKKKAKLKPNSKGQQADRPDNTSNIIEPSQATITDNG